MKERYKRKKTHFLYEIEQCVGRRKLISIGVVKYANRGDYIVQPIQDDGEKIGLPFICSPEDFEKEFEAIK